METIRNLYLEQIVFAEIGVILDGMDLKSALEAVENAVSLINNRNKNLTAVYEATKAVWDSGQINCSDGHDVNRMVELKHCLDAIEGKI